MKKHILIFVISLIYCLFSYSNSDGKEKPTLSLKEIQKSVDEINNNLSKLGWFYGDLAGFSIKEKGEMTAYFIEGPKMQVVAYKKLIIVYSRNGEKDIYEYYFVKNLIYVLKMHNTSEKSIEKEYDQMDKKIIAKFFFVDNKLVKWIGPDNKANDRPNKKLLQEGNFILKQKEIVLENIVMD